MLKEKPRLVDARVAKARMLLREGRAEDAATHAREAVKADAGSAAAQYVLGLTAAERRDYDGAEQAFREVARINPRAAAAQLQLARLQLARGETAGALTAAQAVLKQEADNPEAAVLLARSLRAMGELPRAERELAARIERQPQAAVLRAEMGWVALQQRQVAAARASFHEALRLQPGLYDARAGAVTADIAARELPAARSRVTAWLKESPDDPRIQLLSARLHLVEGNPEAAERELRTVIAKDASQLDAYDLLGRIYVSRGEADKAVAEYEAFAARTPHPAGPITMAAMILEAKGDKDKARAGYERALAADANAGVAANNLAWMYAEEGRLDDALRLATVAKDAMRQRPEAEDTLGWVYYLKGLPGHAVPAFERAVSRAPENAVYHYHLGLAHAKAGNTSEARKALRRALALKTDFQGADEARRMLAQLGQ